MRRKLRAPLLVLLGLVLVAASCSSTPAPSSSAPPKTGSGGAEQTTGEAFKPATFVLEGLATGVLEGIGAAGFHWMLSLVEPDPTAEKLEKIEEGVDRLEREVSQLNQEVQALRGEIDQNFKNEQGVIQDAQLREYRDTIDDALLTLNNFTNDTQSAIANRRSLPKLNDYLGDYGNPHKASRLYGIVYNDINHALTGGGSNVGGGSLIASADTIFAGQVALAEQSKTAAMFDDRYLWQRLGLQEGATAEDIKKACDDLRARQPDSAVCASKDASGQYVPTTSYHDRMRAFVNYYVNYQVVGLQILITALYGWDNGGKCPTPAQGDCVDAADRAKELTMKVVENVRTQLTMAGSPVSTSERVLERSNGEKASLWRTSTTTATFTQEPPPRPPSGAEQWPVPIDCIAVGVNSDKADQGVPCSARDTPFKVKVPSDRSEDQICVGALEENKDVAARLAAGSVNGQHEALPSEWARCTRPDSANATGLRLPTRPEAASALPKRPELYIPGLGDPSAFGSGTYLSYTPAQVFCGQTVEDDIGEPFWGKRGSGSYINVGTDRWLNGLATTWRKAPDWTSTNEFSWYTPTVFNDDTLGFESSGEYPEGGHCQRMKGEGLCGGCGNGAILLKRGFTICILNDPLYSDWCYGHSNYKGHNLPTSGELRVWPVYSLVVCPKQQVDGGVGERIPAWQADGCGADDRPTGKDWEIPGCKMPSGQWTLCGTSWVDAIVPSPAALQAAVTTTTSTAAPASTTTSAAAPTTTTTSTTAPSTTAPTTTAPTTTAPTTTATPSTVRATSTTAPA